MDSRKLAWLVEMQFDEWLLDVRPRLTNEQFRLRSTRRWALREIVDVIRYSENPIEDLNRFSHLMKMYSTVDPKTQKMFSIAHLLAEHVLEFVICLNA